MDWIALQSAAGLWSVRHRRMISCGTRESGASYGIERIQNPGYFAGPLFWRPYIPKYGTCICMSVDK